MPIQVQTPDGNIAEFPDGMSHDAIEGVLRQHYAGPKPESGNTSQTLGFEQGVGKFLANAASPAIAAGDAIGLPMDWARRGQQVIRNPENPNNDRPGGMGRFGAEMLETAPTMLAGPVAGGALSGMQLRDDDTLSGAGTSAGLGAVGGKLGDALVKGAAKVVFPTVSKYAKALLDEGVRLTPGQILGGAYHKAEDALSSIPFVGDMISNARHRGLEDFNRAAINRSLGPIGKNLSPDVTGREAIDEAHRALSDNYTKLVTGTTFQADPTYKQNVSSLLNLAGNIPQYGSKPLQDFIDTNITPRFSKGGVMSGEAFKEIDSLLGQEAKSYRSSPSPNDRKLGNAFGQLQAELKDNLGRTNPSIRQGLADTDAGYANLVRIENAAARPTVNGGSEPGTFTPAQLAAAVRAGDSSVRKNAVARGNALMQDLSDAGKNVLPSQVPDSGTPRRIATGIAAGSGLGLVSVPLAATALGTMGAYTKPGVKLAEALLTKRPAQAKALEKLLHDNSLTLGAMPGAALAAALSGNQQ